MGVFDGVRTHAIQLCISIDYESDALATATCRPRNQNKFT